MKIDQILGLADLVAKDSCTHKPYVYNGEVQEINLDAGLNRNVQEISYGCTIYVKIILKQWIIISYY